MVFHLRNSHLGLLLPISGVKHGVLSLWMLQFDQLINWYKISNKFRSAIAIARESHTHTHGTTVWSIFDGFKWKVFGKEFDSVNTFKLLFSF